MQMIRDIQFDGRIRSDPHRHVADCVEISNLFQYGENQEEAVMLRTFSFSLSAEAKTWLNKLNEGTITSWNEMGESFISRYFSPAKFRYDSTQRILDVGGIFLYKIPNEAFKILDDKVLLKLGFSDDSQKTPNQKLKELTKMQDGRRDNQASQIYMKDDMPMCDLIHEFVYKPPSIRNESDKGDVKAIEEDEIKPISTVPNPKPNKSNSPTVSPFKDCIVHIPYTNAKTFVDDVIPNHVGDKDFKSINGIGIKRMPKIKKDGKGMPKEPYKEWKLNEKAVPHNKEVYHYQWHPTKIPHLNCIIKES
ncbi:hypothetical protein Tco_0059276 [Tanacetum coccineum]